MPPKLNCVNNFLWHNMKTSKLGRPKLPKGEAKNFMLRARVSPKEYDVVEAAAKKEGQGVSEWVRNVTLTAARS